MPTVVPNAEAGSARRRVDDPCSRMAVDARRWRRERFQWRHAGHDGVGRRKKTGGEEKKRGGGACRTTGDEMGRPAATASGPTGLDAGEGAIPIPGRPTAGTAVNPEM